MISGGLLWVDKEVTIYSSHVSIDYHMSRIRRLTHRRS